MLQPAGPRARRKFSSNAGGNWASARAIPGAQARARLAAIVESSADGILSIGLDGRINTWNPGAERIFGYTAAEAVGKPISLLIPPDHAHEEPAILERIKQGERFDHYQTVRVTK